MGGTVTHTHRGFGKALVKGSSVAQRTEKPRQELSPDEQGKRELIGDALALLYAREHLRYAYPEIPKHHYHDLGQFLSCNATLTDLARAAGLAPVDDTSKGLARAFEIHLATLHLERGFRHARLFFKRAIEKRFDIPATASTWHPRTGITPVLHITQTTKPCAHCDEGFAARKGESRRQFAARRFCSCRCAGAAKTGTRRPVYNTRKGSTTVACAICGEPVVRTMYRVHHSATGRFYCSVEHQNQDRKRGGALATPISELRQKVAADARTGLYSLRELAERHASSENIVGGFLHRAGVSLIEARAANCREADNG